MLDSFIRKDFIAALKYYLDLIYFYKETTHSSMLRFRDGFSPSPARIGVRTLKKVDKTVMTRFSNIVKRFHKL